MAEDTKRHREMADVISRLFWDNYLKSEPALTMRDVIAIELEKAEDRGKAEAAYYKHIYGKFVGYLATRYKEGEAVHIAGWCDEHLDQSGRLLGEVRDVARAPVGQVREGS